MWTLFRYITEFLTIYTVNDYKYHRNTSTRNTGSNETVILVTSRIGTKKTYSNCLDRHSRQIQLVPGDQRSGRYYSGITHYNLFQKSARSHCFSRVWHWMTDFVRAIFQIFRERKNNVFFLPANIYGALMYLIACWFRSGHIYYIYFPDCPLFLDFHFINPMLMISSQIGPKSKRPQNKSQIGHIFQIE